MTCAPHARRIAGGLLALALLAATLVVVAREARAGGGAPFRLADTGLYADFATRTIDPEVLTYAPQYPLWTDGAEKRRFVRVPAGTHVDASDPDAWTFPVGTRLWKEFAYDGRPVETRYMERRADGTWLYATYAWTADGADAVLAPERGLAAVRTIAPGVAHDIPGAIDCRACHQGQPNEVLGFSALQLSPDRDPLAPHGGPVPAGAVDLPELVRRGLVVGLPQAVLEHPPRIVAATPAARAALGYLHGNCGGCHNARGPLADLGFSFEHTTGVQQAADEPALRTALARAAAIEKRIASRDPLVQMPPLGTKLVDGRAVALVEEWIHDLHRGN